MIICQSPTAGIDTAPRQFMESSDMLVASDAGQSVALYGRYECSDWLFMLCKGLCEIQASCNRGTSLIERYENQWDHLNLLFIKEAAQSLAL